MNYFQKVDKFIEIDHIHSFLDVIRLRPSSSASTNELSKTDRTINPSLRLFFV